ncbi:uncharacterized protein [Mobula birostris]|uniref:uncharacterized protein isoform X1 n=2 Tax=Mobula birostris TaxID=1983395 RepID=UPI003B27C03A
MGRCPEVAGRSAEASASAQHSPTWLTAETPCKMHLYPRLWILTFLLQAASALEIEDIQMPKTRFDANEGDRLLVPCSFKADETVQSSDLRLEWGVIMEPSGSYRPIYRVVGSMLEPITEPNPYEGRAQMFISLIPKGNCSLVLQPVLARDAGQYELRLYSQGEMTVNGQKVVVAVHSGKAPGPLKEMKTGTASVKDRTLEGVNGDTCREFSNFDKHLMTLTKGINSVSTRTGVSTLGLEIVAGVVTGILLVGTVAGILFCCYLYKGLKALRKGKSRRQKCRKYCRKSKHRRPRTEDPVTREEEVFQVETPEPTMSSLPEQGEHQRASDTNSTLYGFDMLQSN